MRMREHNHGWDEILFCLTESWEPGTVDTWIRILSTPPPGTSIYSTAARASLLWLAGGCYCCSGLCSAGTGLAVGEYYSQPVRFAGLLWLKVLFASLL
jgi:hypothetical protein